MIAWPDPITCQVFEEPADLILGENKRKTAGPFTLCELADFAEGKVQRVLVQKRQGIQGLTLRIRRHAPYVRKVGQVHFHLLRTQLLWGSIAMESDEPHYPLLVALFRADGIMSATDCLPQTFQLRWVLVNDTPALKRIGEYLVSARYSDMLTYLVELLQFVRKVEMRFLPPVPRKLGGPWGFDNLLKKNAQCVNNLAILPILESAFCGLSAKVGSQVLCRVLFQAESLGRFDKIFSTFDTPVGRLTVEAVGSECPSVAVTKGVFSILIRLMIDSRSPPELIG